MFTGELVTTIPNDRKTCFVNVDSYENKQLSGTIYNPHYKYSEPYYSLMELIPAHYRRGVLLGRCRRGPR